MNKKMQKHLDDYKALIVDMDGTLYHQAQVRQRMAIKLFICCLTRRVRFKELMILREYRKLRETREFSEGDDFEEKQIDKISGKYKVKPECVKEVLGAWMIDIPLKYIRMSRDVNLIGTLTQMRAAGKVIIIYSDYPVKDKLKALELNTDFAFCAEDPEIRCMKPDTKGLKHIISVSGKDIEEILFIGDREERDGECAARIGMDHLILPPGKRRRKRLYKELIQNG